MQKGNNKTENTFEKIVIIKRTSEELLLPVLEFKDLSHEFISADPRPMQFK